MILRYLYLLQQLKENRRVRRSNAFLILQPNVQLHLNFGQPRHSVRAIAMRILTSRILNLPMRQLALATLLSVH